MYASNVQSGTPMPPITSNDYEMEVRTYNRIYVPAEQQEELTEKMMLANILPIIEEKGECIIYMVICWKMVFLKTKMRYSYFDRENSILVMTRTDITEIKEEKRQKQLLQDALNAASAANKAKSEFLSRMSHDIRTPMNAIIGMTAIAGAHIEEQDRVADCLAKITSSSRLLLGLINEVLDMAKVESGNIVWRKKRSTWLA